MNFLKKLFGKQTTLSNKNASAKPPASSQATDDPNQKPKFVRANTPPEIEPIVLQTLGVLFKNVDDQQQAQKIIQKYKRDRGSADLKTLLAVLKYSNADLVLLEKSLWQSHPHFWMDEISPIFRNLEAAEKWANSLSESQI
jgi:hypothetical protein